MKSTLNFFLLLFVFVLSAGCEFENHSLIEKAGEQPAKFRDLNDNDTMEPYEDPARPVAERIDDILDRMTLEQKVYMVSGVGWAREGRPKEIDKVPGAAGYTYPVKTLGIPSIVLVDGPAGVRISPTREGEENTFHATAFPIETLLASTWDLDLVNNVGAAMGKEVKEYGADVLLAPGMNIHRDPLGGRNFEYYSEDPYLSGYLAAALVNGIESVGVGATLKHFVANNQETNRYLLNTVLSERTLREIYLRGFEITVQKSQPWAIMSAYNQINGSSASQNKPLMTTVLRDEWHFDGVNMTDWFAGDDPVAQMKAGNELLMPGTDTNTTILTEATQSGQLDEATLDRNLRHILAMILKSPTFSGYEYSDKPDLTAHAKIARAAAADGVVLLKNNRQTLPLTATVKRIAAFGKTSYEFLSGGTGSGDVYEAYTVSLVQGLEARGYTVDPDLKKTYEAFILEEKAKLPEIKYFFESLPPIPEMPVSDEVLAEKASQSDIAFITIGRNSGEFKDRTLDGDFYLTEAEQKLIEDVSNAFHKVGKKVVLILNIGNVVETVSWRDKVDAIVLPWQGGQEAGSALADVLTGKVNPSGKLPTTFPVKYDDVPSSTNFPGVEISDETILIAGMLPAKFSRVEYEEGIYVGYRYYDSFSVKPAYEFGYGLSYTDFAYGQVTLSQEVFTDSITATVLVTNSGRVAGKEVVQLYITAPVGELSKPAKELKAFAKTRKLTPGESQQLTFTLNPRDLASFDSSRSTWIAEGGTYKVSVGASSRDIKTTATFRLDNETVVMRTLADLAPQQKLDEFAP